MSMNVAQSLIVGKMIFLVLLASFLALPALALPSAAANQTNFAQTCRRAKLVDGYYLEAWCLDANGTHPFKNTLDLNFCVGIDYSTSVLQWMVYGKLANYCSHCSLEHDNPNHPVLDCACQTSGQKSGIFSTLKLDEGIYNNNGTLTCDGGIATIG
ncbi:hypothetical protein B0T16DRAFT_123862 [Cercophora newfieldiana]|uniref:Cyanovirin-N domain-containing protein n=1 Tax=Cercophora newfieldiana TaxID=92897 RepID=A0AA39YCC8_9PEZI|nr:hypothetical protein B0T16DRAFT_123862 [Cercophora newfieldiana]